MIDFPLGYEKINATTWVYLSSLLMIGLYFKFSRYWSLRNVDLLLLIALAPGLLLVGHGRETRMVAAYNLRDYRLEQAAEEGDAPPEPTAVAAEEPPPPPRKITAEEASYIQAQQRGKTLEFVGFLWLFVIGIVLCVRLLLDPTMTRRPLLQPNLSLGGLMFLGVSMFVFLMANVIVSEPSADDLNTARMSHRILKGESAEGDALTRHGPGFVLFHLLPSLPTMSMSDRSEMPEEIREKREQTVFGAVAKTMAILGHLTIVVGIVCIGYWHFGNLHSGTGIATLYLILPYTAQMTGRVEHVLPAAMLVMGVLFYRRPLTSGTFLGLAMAMVYYPLFLLPLWISFYWQRGLGRFLLGIGITLSVGALSLIFLSESVGDYWSHLRAMFGLWPPLWQDLHGLWGLGWWPVYRIPILAGFVVLCGTFAMWPAQKNLGTLISCSAVVMVATQFWHGFGGGLFMAWYLPLLLLTIFRPNLEDRVALAVLGDGFLSRKAQTEVERAA